MWLYGYVGCGKSSIAQAVAEEFFRRDCLVASFFFFRGSGDRSRTTRLAATIAGQMIRAIPSTASYVKDALKKHPDILTSYPIKLQFQHLVFEPFKMASKWTLGPISLLTGSFLVVIDGMDECEDREEVASLIDHMISFFKDNRRIPLRFFITSRVEEHIRTHLESPQVKLVNLADNAALEDIAYVMEMTFKEAARHNRVIQAYGEQWPSKGDLQKLVEHTGGSFIFMATILRFILGTGRPGSVNPIKQLPLALHIDPGLDGLYAQTLALSEHYPYFTEIISAIALIKYPLSVNGLALLLDIPRYEVVQVLIHLQAIFQVPGDDRTPVVLCHSSLHDFLNTERRSGRFHASPSNQKRVAEDCLRALSRYNAQYPGQHPGGGDEACHYASNFVLSHWQDSLSFLPDDIDNLREQVDLVASYYKTAMPGRMGNTAISTFFAVQRRLLIGCNDRGLASHISKRVVMGLLATVLRPTLPGGLGVLEVLVSKYSDGLQSQRLEEYLGRINPEYLSPSYSALLIMNAGQNLLYTVDLEDETTAICFGRKRPSITTTEVYLYAFWLDHLKYAVENDDTIEPSALTTPQFFGNSGTGLHNDGGFKEWEGHPRIQTWWDNLASDVVLARRAIVDKFPLIQMSPSPSVIWRRLMDSDGYHRYGFTSSIVFSIIDLLYGFEGLSPLKCDSPDLPYFNFKRDF
ncbi:hypothetical protein DFP72DRAFT_1011525 [Ephemerocybe angulata]|uniref:Nephrocystin 3-like N-terminal domain-containing protein n=1 Tax=Ephemerocybe angulata TaxID=980116 RepID=A0A8H6HTV9_9AGAR|nr:hypothetical protein DFP72DRAFT_1011525 [Tulosesus angulatus]